MKLSPVEDTQRSSGDLLLRIHHADAGTSSYDPYQEILHADDVAHGQYGSGSGDLHARGNRDFDDSHVKHGGHRPGSLSANRALGRQIVTGCSILMLFAWCTYHQVQLAKFVQPGRDSDAGALAQLQMSSLHTDQALQLSYNNQPVFAWMVEQGFSGMTMFVHNTSTQVRIPSAFLNTSAQALIGNITADYVVGRLAYPCENVVPGTGVNYYLGTDLQLLCGSREALPAAPQMFCMGFEQPLCKYTSYLTAHLAFPSAPTIVHRIEIVLRLSAAQCIPVAAASQQEIH